MTPPGGFSPAQWLKEWLKPPTDPTNSLPCLQILDAYAKEGLFAPFFSQKKRPRALSFYLQNSRCYAQKALELYQKRSLLARQSIEDLHPWLRLLYANGKASKWLKQPLCKAQRAVQVGVKPEEFEHIIRCFFELQSAFALLHDLPEGYSVTLGGDRPALQPVVAINNHPQKSIDLQVKDPYGFVIAQTEVTSVGRLLHHPSELLGPLKHIVDKIPGKYGHCDLLGSIAIRLAEEISAPVFVAGLVNILNHPEGQASQEQGLWQKLSKELHGIYLIPHYINDPLPALGYCQKQGDHWVPLDFYRPSKTWQ